MSVNRPVFAAATVAIVSSLLLGCAQASPKTLSTSDSDASTSECDSAASTAEASPGNLATTTTPTPWNTCLFGPDPEVLEREAEPAIYAAKSEAIAFMHEIAAQLPADNVANFTNDATGMLMRCGPDEMQLYSIGEITLKAEADPDRTLAAIGGHWKTKPGYTVVHYRSDGTPKVWIRGPKHTGYITGLAPHDTTMSISAFSPCFKVPTDFLPGGEY